MYHLERFTLQEVFLKSTTEYGSYPALGMLDGKMYTYREVGILVRRLIQTLKTHYGAGPGSHIALISENRPEWPIAYLSVTSLGAVIVPVLTDFSPEAIRNILTHA
jgi:long-chain acyl-CoA synthetase